MKNTLVTSLLLLSSLAQAERFVVESKHPLKLSDLKIPDVKIEKFYPGNMPAFNNRYLVSGRTNIESLKRLTWVKEVEATFELKHFSLTHPDGVRRLVNDELFPYQWGLLNQGQTYYKEKDDIHNLPLVGLPKRDIGWENLFQKKSEIRPIVAVLDSGVDLDHPDIQGNLWTNKEECGKDPKVDNDGNQLAGDCRGWNFTEAIDSDEAKIPNDKDGHGTHVAGIIAAAQNDEGIVGVAPNALIMPIKVMRDSSSKSEIASSESFARGILYAVDNGATVINMSLGWPRSLETKYLRDAVLLAISKGVVIVAAAGNNNSADPLFPCAYEGVICVAASTLDGSFAGFSNYGSHVDTIAPGEGILSLNPTIFEPDFFMVPGYDIKSGTSQSSPFVAGLIAALKSHEKDISLDEILGRLYQAQKSSDKTKYVLGGQASWEALSEKINSSVIRPILKRVRQITLRVGGPDVKVIIPVKNFGKDSSSVSVKIESLTKSISFSSDSFSVGSLKSGETQEIAVPVTDFDLNGEAHIILKVTINENGIEHSYLNEIPVVRDIRAEADFTKMGFAFTDKPLPVGGVRNGLVQSTISTVESYTQSGAHEFFMKRMIKKEGSTEQQLEVTIFRRINNKYVQVPNFILINNALNMNNLIRIDLNQDGKEDYLVQTLVEKDGKKYFDFSFFNSELKALWPEFQNVKLVLDLAVESILDLSFINYQHPKLGKMFVPAFFTVGQIPKIDQVPVFNRYDASKRNRLYYLEPQEGSFRIRALTNNIWEEQVKKELNTKWFATVETEQLLPATEQDKELGQLRVILSVGLGTKREIFISTFDTKSTIRAAKLPQLVLQTEIIDPLLSISSTGLKVHGEAFFNIYDRTRAKLVTTKNSAQESEYVYRHDTVSDVVAGHLATFSNGQNRFSVIQTREKLVALSNRDGVIKTSERPKMRYSFLSQRLLSEMYLPVMYKRDNRLAPALYVDSTSVTLNRVYLFEEQQGDLVLSIRNSLMVPSNCKPLNPFFSRTTVSYEFLFLCLEDKDWMIRSFEMN